MAAIMSSEPGINLCYSSGGAAAAAAVFSPGVADDHPFLVGRFLLTSIGGRG